MLDPAGESVGGLAFPTSGLRERRQQFPRMLDRLDEASMDERVIGLEQIKTGDQALVQLPELGEVDLILNPVMVIEMVQKGIELRNEGLLQLHSIEFLTAVSIHDPNDFASFAAQTGMHMQPEIGELTEVLMRSPLAGRVLRTQIGKIVRQPLARPKRHWFGCCFVHATHHYSREPDRRLTNRLSWRALQELWSGKRGLRCSCRASTCIQHPV